MTVTTERAVAGVPSTTGRCPWCFQSVSVSVVSHGAALAGDAMVAACADCGHAYAWFLLGRLLRVPMHGIEELPPEVARMLAKAHRARCQGQCQDEDILLIEDPSRVGEC